MEPNNRFAFAHTLRGLACLLVVLYHLVLMFGAEAETVVKLTGLDHPPRSSHLVQTLVAYLPINLGCFGVALFFLISGLVIPPALARSDRTSFVIARFFRLVPTYVCCLGLTLLGLWTAHACFGHAYDVPWQSALLHVALLRDLACLEPIDGVVWTLEVEAKFYLLCLLLAPALRAGDARGILLGSAAVTGIIVWAGDVPIRYAEENLRWYAAIRSLQLCALSMSFMWMGAILCFHHSKRCSTRQMMLSLLLLDAMFILQAVYSGVWGVFPLQIIASYQAALGLFLVAYHWPAQFSGSALLDRVADVSYSFYVLHGALGYATGQLVYAATGNLYLSMAVAIGAMFALATIVHRFVERPTQQFGKRLASQWQAWRRDSELHVPATPAILRRAA